MGLTGTMLIITATTSVPDDRPSSRSSRVDPWLIYGSRRDGVCRPRTSSYAINSQLSRTAHRLPINLSRTTEIAGADNAEFRLIHPGKAHCRAAAAHAVDRVHLTRIQLALQTKLIINDIGRLSIKLAQECGIPCKRRCAEDECRFVTSRRALK